MVIARPFRAEEIRRARKALRRAILELDSEGRCFTTGDALAHAVIWRAGEIDPVATRVAWASVRRNAKIPEIDVIMLAIADCSTNCSAEEERAVLAAWGRLLSGEYCQRL